jgi:hypothetical protein
MTPNFRPATVALLALALLAPLSSFAIGRDLTPVRMATPDYLLQSSGLCVTEKGFLLRWSAAGDTVGLTRITRGGEPYGSAFAGTVSTNGSAADSPPAVAANSAGDTAIVTTELNTVWMIDRARFYFASEFPLPRRRATR